MGLKSKLLLRTFGSCRSNVSAISTDPEVFDTLVPSGQKHHSHHSADTRWVSQLWRKSRKHSTDCLIHEPDHSLVALLRAWRESVEYGSPFSSAAELALCNQVVRCCELDSPTEVGYTAGQSNYFSPKSSKSRNVYVDRHTACIVAEFLSTRIVACAESADDAAKSNSISALAKAAAALCEHKENGQTFRLEFAQEELLDSAASVLQPFNRVTVEAKSLLIVMLQALIGDSPYITKLVIDCRLLPVLLGYVNGSVAQGSRLSATARVSCQRVVQACVANREADRRLRSK